MAATARAAPPPPAVTVVPVEVRDVAPVHTFPGQVQAIQSVTLVARVSAYVDKVVFQEGSLVKSGQLLFQLQQGPYQAAVEQAQGTLKQAQATLLNAQLNYERDSKAGGLAISQQQVQQDISARDVAAGQVASARGALETAAINLSYCTVASPIDGRIGKALYTAGNLVSPTSGALATVVQVDPIRVAFSVADAQVLAAEQAHKQTQQQISDSVTLDVQLPDGAAYNHPGKVEFVNNQVDAATGTLTVWGRFENPEGLLIPGAYVTVSVRRTKPDKRPLVPVQAVQNDQQGQFVLLVGADNKVEQRQIKTGQQVGQGFIVEAGLTGGERVITEGVQKVHPGEVVNPSTPTVLPGGGGASPSGSPAAKG
jgi:membrane fusion protein (multidrug efflux system)